MKILGLVAGGGGVRAGKTWCVEIQSHGKLPTQKAFLKCGYHCTYFPSHLSVLVCEGK